jgi:hypothetical protein
MNFSEFISQTSGIVKYSPNGDLVAVAKTFEVKVRLIHICFYFIF